MIARILVYLIIALTPVEFSYLAYRHWGKRGAVICFTVCAVILYALFGGLMYVAVHIGGQECGFSAYDSEWGVQESALWPIMLITGQTPSQSCYASTRQTL